MMERELVELRARVATLERTVAFLQQHLGVAYVDVVPGGVSPAVVALVRKGDKIAAIKLQREITGAGLAEAKAVVDGIE